MLSDLEHEYDMMNHRNSLCIKPRPDLSSAAEEVERCLAISTFDGWELSIPTWERFINWLEPLICEGISYAPHPSKNIQGRLHWTLQQCMPFGSTIDLSGKDLKVLQPILDTLRGVTIHYRGIVITPAGIALRGFPATQRDYTRILHARACLCEALQSIGIPYNPPYINTICHSTVFRWTQSPTEDQLDYVKSGVIQWQEAHIATIRPYKWSFGFMTLRCRDHENRIAHIYHTPLQIAHRGLLYGPDSEKENTLQQLTDNIIHNRISECDIWYTGNSYYLGHDAPTIKIEKQWLIEHKELLLIHAKTPDTFHNLHSLRKEEGVDLHLFYHTDEDIVLTTKQDVIVFPGLQINPGWVSMMPERAPHITIEDASIICSDFI